VAHTRGALLYIYFYVFYVQLGFYKITISDIISIRIRWQIIEKSLAGLLCRTIARHLGIGKSSVSRILQHFRDYGCVEDLPSLSGRPRLLTADDMKYFETLLKEKADWYLWELQTEMEHWLDRNVCYTTIWRTVHRLGYSHKQACLEIYLL
jgi:transposase